jgi:hypothetical protein
MQILRPTALLKFQATSNRVLLLRHNILPYAFLSALSVKLLLSHGRQQELLGLPDHDQTINKRVKRTCRSPRRKHHLRPDSMTLLRPPYAAAGQ